MAPADMNAADVNGLTLLTHSLPTGAIQKETTDKDDTGTAWHRVERSSTFASRALVSVFSHRVHASLHRIASHAAHPRHANAFLLALPGIRRSPERDCEPREWWYVDTGSGDLRCTHTHLMYSAQRVREEAQRAGAACVAAGRLVASALTTPGQSGAARSRSTESAAITSSRSCQGQWRGTQH